MISATATATAGETACEQDHPERTDEHGRHVGEPEVNRTVRVEYEQHAQHERGDAARQDRDASRAHYWPTPVEASQASFVPNASRWTWLPNQPPPPPQSPQP